MQQAGSNKPGFRFAAAYGRYAYRSIRACTGICRWVYGSYVHGIFDAGDLAYRIAETLAERKGRSLRADATDYAAFKEEQYDKLAETMREYLDMDAVYGMLREAKL